MACGGDHAEWERQNEEEAIHVLAETSPEDAQRLCRHIFVKAIERDMVECQDCNKLMATVVWAVDRAKKVI